MERLSALRREEDRNASLFEFTTYVLPVGGERRDGAATVAGACHEGTKVPADDLYSGGVFKRQFGLCLRHNETQI